MSDTILIFVMGYHLFYDAVSTYEVHVWIIYVEFFI
jgi:hypothetical protein